MYPGRGPSAGIKMNTVSEQMLRAAKDLVFSLQASIKQSWVANPSQRHCVCVGKHCLLLPYHQLQPNGWKHGAQIALKCGEVSQWHLQAPLSPFWEYLEHKLCLQGENFLFWHPGTVVTRSACGAGVVPISPGSAGEVQEGLNADRGLTELPALDSQTP